MSEQPVRVSSVVWALVGLVATVGLSLGAYSVGQRMSGVSGEAVAGAAGGQAVMVSVNGGELFALNCAGCHGGKAEGGVGPALGVTKSWTQPVFSEAVLHGQAEGRTLSSLMPHFAETGFSGEPATPAQLEAVHNFIKSL